MTESIAAWWNRLRPETRAVLAQNPAEPVPLDLMPDVTAATNTAGGASLPTTPDLPPEVQDWIVNHTRVSFSIHHDNPGVIDEVLALLLGPGMAVARRDGHTVHIVVPTPHADEARSILRRAATQHAGFTWQEGPPR